MPYVCMRQGDGWVKKRKDTGRIVSHHATQEKCNASIRAYYATKELNEELAKAARYTPPAAGPNAPAEIKRILSAAYSSCRMEHPGEVQANKTLCARIAWGAVRGAGWIKGPDGKWSKKSTRR